tara:strand:- start:438 stop:911 length:474 start_codon:yes stop_codon:yes gene_type:complete
MERKAFLKTLGAGAAFALAFPCLHGCSSDSGNSDVDPEDQKPVPTGVDFTIDLNASSSANLQSNGGFIFAKSKETFTENNIIIVRNLEGNLVAASKICSHQQTDAVEFVNEGVGIYECSTHGSRFDQTGKPLNSITTNPLKIFNTELLANDMLRIFE